MSVEQINETEYSVEKLKDDNHLYIGLQNAIDKIFSNKILLSYIDSMETKFERSTVAIGKIENSFTLEEYFDFIDMASDTEFWQWFFVSTIVNQLTCFKFVRFELYKTLNKTTLQPRIEMVLYYG